LIIKFPFFISGHKENRREGLNASKFNNIDAYLFSLVIAAATLGPVVCVVGVAMNLDPAYFFLEKLILPNPYGRSILCIVVSFLFRYFIAFLYLMEFLRFAIFAIIILFLLLIHTNYLLKHVQTLRNNAESLKCYQQYRILLGEVSKHLSETLLNILFVVYVLTVMGFWVSIKGWGFVPTIFLNLYCLLFCQFGLVGNVVSSWCGES